MKAAKWTGFVLMIKYFSFAWKGGRDLGYAEMGCRAATVQCAWKLLVGSCMDGVVCPPMVDMYPQPDAFVPAFRTWQIYFTLDSTTEAWHD